jgi:hypothetical protein
MRIHWAGQLATMLQCMSPVMAETEVRRRPRFGRYRELSGPKADIAETTLLTHIRSGVCIAAVEAMLIFTGGRPQYTRFTGLDSTERSVKVNAGGLNRVEGIGFLQPHFEYDVFVSYSHGVRAGDAAAPLKDWTLELISRLETDIRAAYTEFDDLQIWRDKQIDPTIHLTDELRGKVKSSGILMIVMSPRYLGSTWCKDELDWFKQQVENRGRDQGCVFVTQPRPISSNNRCRLFDQLRNGRWM